MKPVQDQIQNILTEQRLVRKPAGMGLTMLYNNEIMIAGGMRSGNSPAYITRMKYVIYDLILVRKLVEEGMDRDDAFDQAISGQIQLFILDDTDTEIHGVSDIQITQKKAGIGRKVIKALVDDCAANNKPLHVYDIMKNALGFWDKMGCKFYNTSFGYNNIKQRSDTEPVTLAQAKKMKRVPMGIINPEYLPPLEDEPKPIKLTGFKRLD